MYYFLMNVALIDDMPGELSRIIGIINEYTAASHAPIKTESFTSAEDFLSDYMPHKYLLIFMDIYMEGMNGVEAAKKIRETDKDTLIVFLTTSPDHTFDAFGVHAYQYIIKVPEIDVLRENIFQVLDDVIALRNPSEEGIVISVEGEEKSLPYSDLVYAQTDRNYIKITDREANIFRTRMTFSDISSLLEKDKRFLRINRGIIINMDYIESFGKEICTLKGGYNLPISVRERKSLDQIRRNYVFFKLHNKPVKGGSV